nr:hypothetical protein [uncultured Methanolobus sp.]
MKKSESLCLNFYGGGLCKERCRKAKREIIKKFVEVNDWYPETELIDYVKVNKLCYNRSNFDRSYMDRFVSDEINILEGPCKHLYCTNKELISYCLKKDIHTLRILVNCVYTKDNYPELFKSEYYLSMLDLVIDNLAQYVSLDKNFNFTSSEREILKHYLKYTYSGLKFCLDPDFDRENIEAYKTKAIDKIRVENVGFVFAYLDTLRITDSVNIDTSIFDAKLNIPGNQLSNIAETIKTQIREKIKVQLRKSDKLFTEPPVRFIECYTYICIMEHFVAEDAALGLRQKLPEFDSDAEKMMNLLGKMIFEYMKE